MTMEALAKRRGGRERMQRATKPYMHENGKTEETNNGR